MTVDISFGSQSSRLKIEHFRHWQELRLELPPLLAPLLAPEVAPELAPLSAASAGARLSAEDAFRRSADAGSRMLSEEDERQRSWRARIEDSD